MEFSNLYVDEIYWMQMLLQYERHLDSWQNLFIVIPWKSNFGSIFISTNKPAADKHVDHTKFI